MLALHNECLTRRYLLGRLDFLESIFGLALGIFRALEGFGKLGRLRLEVMLQGCTSATRASSLSRSVRSVAALASASDSAFFRAATSVAAPIKNHNPFLLASSIFSST